MSELKIGDSVLVKPVEKKGTINDISSGSYWVDFDEEYGGKFWYSHDLKLIQEDEYSARV